MAFRTLNDAARVPPIKGYANRIRPGKALCRVPACRQRGPQRAGARGCVRGADLLGPEGLAAEVAPPNTPKEFRTKLLREIGMWEKIIRASGIRIE